MNDILYSIDSTNLKFMLLAPLNIYHLIIKDFNIFSEKKTNLGLFFYIIF